MSKFSQKLKTGLVLFFFLGTSFAYGQTFWSNKGSDWGEPAAKAFDGLTNTKWSQPGQTGWIGGMYSAPVKYNKLIITNTNDGFEGGVGMRDFKDWILKASNDTLVSWTTLDTQTGIQFATPASSKTFMFTNETAYKYYRFYFTNNGNSYTQVAELALSFEAPPEETTFWSSRGSHWGEPADNAFDGILRTKWSQPGSEGWIGGRYAVPVKYNKLIITNTNDGFVGSGVRDFKDWILKASNDTLVSWTTLDTQTGIQFDSPASSKTFMFTNETAYKYYRFDFVNNGNTYTQLSELALSYEVATPLNSVVLSGSEINGGVKLIWNTIGERNTKSFDVLRKNADDNFIIIATVNSKQNGDNTYSFFDAAALPGDNYYKLQNNDLSGNPTYSDVVHVKVATLEGNTTVYPNPAINGIVNVASNQSIKSVSIYDVSTGIKYISNTYDGLDKNVQINIQSLTKGVYIVEVTSKLSVSRKKLVIN